MRITLAYEYEGNPPNSTIDVDDRTGKQMLRDGRARKPSVHGQTVPELRDYAASAGIDLAGARKRDDIVAVIEQAETTPAPGGTAAPISEGA